MLPQESRFCKFSKTKEVEDEIHLLFACSMYSDLREIFLDKLRCLDINIKKDSKDIPILFTPGNNNLTIYVANYIHKYVSQNVREK